MEEMQHIAEQWLKAYAYTVATGNVDAHLDLVSTRLQVVGISRRGFLEYRDWAKRRRNDIAKGRLLRVSHRQLELGACAAGRLCFRVEETLKSNRGETYVLDKDVVLNLDPDGKWREVEEFVHNVRLLPPDERHVRPPTPAPATPGDPG